MTKNTAEEWKPVEGFPYEVSNLGRVRRVEPRTNTRFHHILKPGPKSHGYLGVTLNAPGKRITRLVHVLVCTAFHGEKPTPRHQVAHRDGNNQNNNATNLYWATPKENQDDMRRHGRMRLGSMHPNSKLSESDVVDIRALKGRMTQTEIGDLYGVDHSTIGRILRGKQWRHV